MKRVGSKAVRSQCISAFHSTLARLTTISTAIYTLFINKQWKNVSAWWENEMPIKQLTLSEINAFDQARFTAELASLFEGPPWIVNEAWHTRPFTSLEQLHQALCSVMYSAPIEQQEALLLAHPDLVGRAALAGTLSPASTSEQASAGLDRLSPEEIATFTRLNQAYHERFGFPFIICVRENKKESILAGFNTRLHHSRSREIEIALGEVAKICAFRLRDLVLA
jgi:2-oxo-4-hydroxy-4-carboxy-5-ureidoimidazoline decarboxylase